MSGLETRFFITRLRNPWKHRDCRYFVLDLTDDPHALVAIQAYANSCREQHPELAADLEAIHG